MSKLQGRVLSHPTSTLEAPTNECNRFFSYRYFVQSLFFYRGYYRKPKDDQMP